MLGVANTTGIAGIDFQKVGDAIGVILSLDVDQSVALEMAGCTKRQLYCGGVSLKGLMKALLAASHICDRLATFAHHVDRTFASCEVRHDQERCPLRRSAIGLQVGLEIDFPAVRVGKATERVRSLFEPPEALSVNAHRGLNAHLSMCTELSVRVRQLLGVGGSDGGHAGQMCQFGFGGEVGLVVYQMEGIHRQSASDQIQTRINETLPLSLKDAAYPASKDHLDTVGDCGIQYPVDALLVVRRLGEADISVGGYLRPVLAMGSADLDMCWKGFPCTKDYVALAGLPFKKPDQNKALRSLGIECHKWMDDEGGDNSRDIPTNQRQEFYWSFCSIFAD